MQQPPNPMTLDNMRANGVWALVVWCTNITCRHEAIVNVDSLGDDVPVPSLGPRMRCQRCGQLGADARPNWNERPTVRACLTLPGQVTNQIK